MPLTGLLESKVDEQELTAWHALRVRSRHEHVVMQGLQGRGYEEFTPMYRSTSQWSDRLKEVQRPLFPGYVFGRFGLNDRMHIIRTPGVIEVVGNGATPVDETELAAVRLLVASGLPLAPWQYIQPNDRIMIQNGPFRGMEGVAVKVKQERRLVVSISLLQRAVSVELDASWVTPIGPRRPDRMYKHHLKVCAQQAQEAVAS